MTVRAFLAIQLDDATIRAIGALQQVLKTTLRIDAESPVRLRWVQPETFHVTLKFFGDIAESHIPTIQQALANICAGTAPFTLTFDQLGVFPQLRAPRVLWLGAQMATSGATSLRALAAAIDQALIPCGFPAETKPLQPHLTLARIRDGGSVLGQALMRTGLLAQPAASLIERADHLVCRIAAVHLMQSHLRPAGPTYTALWSLPLQGQAR